MNIATQALATVEPEGASRRSGRSRAIITTGSMIGLIVGALLAERLGPRMVFLLLAAVALWGLPLAWRLPGGHGQKIPGGPRFGLPDRLDSWSFVQGMALDGLFVIGLSVLAAASMPEGALLAAGAALALRYASEIALGLLGGVLGERFGPSRVLILLTLGSAAGLAAVGMGALWTGIIIVVLLRGLLQPLPARSAAASVPAAERVSGPGPSRHLAGSGRRPGPPGGGGAASPAADLASLRRDRRSAGDRLGDAVAAEMTPI